MLIYHSSRPPRGRRQRLEKLSATAARPAIPPAPIYILPSTPRKVSELMNTLFVPARVLKSLCPWPISRLIWTLCYTYNMPQGGFIKTLLLVVIIVAILTYYKIDLRALIGDWWSIARQWFDSMLR